MVEECEVGAFVGEGDESTVIAEFKKDMTEATRTHGYVEYRMTRDWVRGIETLLDRISSMVDNGRAGVVLQLLDHFFARMDEALGDIDDSDGGGGEVYANACEIHRAACRQAKPHPVLLPRSLFGREADSDCEFFPG